MAECLVLGWVFPIRRLREHANERSDWRIGPWWDWSIRVVIPAILLFLIGWSIYGDFHELNNYSLVNENGKLVWFNWVGFGLILILPVAGWCLARFLGRSKRQEMRYRV